MRLSLAEVEASLDRTLRKMLRYPNAPSPDVAGDLEDLMRLQPNEGAGFSLGSVDGVEVRDWWQRKSRRVGCRGIIDYLLNANCYLEVFEAEFLIPPRREGLEGYTLRIGRRGFESRRIPHHERRRELLAELGQMGADDWAYVFAKGRSD